MSKTVYKTFTIAASQAIQCNGMHAEHHVKLKKKMLTYFKKYLIRCRNLSHTATQVCNKISLIFTL